MDALEELKKKLVGLVEENDTLKAKEEETTGKIKAIIGENCEKFVIPVYNELREIDNLCYRVTQHAFRLTDEPVIYYYPSCYYSTGLLIKGHSTETFLHFGCFDNDNIKHFSTVESTLEFVEELKKVFIHRFEVFLPLLEKKNAELKSQVDNLITLLENSSTVEEKSNGTIELTINGKKYVGKLVEQ